MAAKKAAPVKAQSEKRRRDLARRKLRRALETTRPNKNQLKLKEKIKLAKELEPIEHSNQSEQNEDSAESNRKFQEAEEIQDQNVEVEVNAVENKQMIEDPSFSDKSLSNQSKQKASVSKHRPQKLKDDSLLVFFRTQIATTQTSSKMQKEYERLILAGLNIQDRDQLQKMRKLFMEEQVLTSYRQYLATRDPPRPKEFDMLSLDEQIWVCLHIAESFEVVVQHGYTLARELFEFLAQKRSFGGKLDLSTTQIKFLKDSLVLAFEDVSTVSQSIIEVYLRADLLPELINHMKEKDIFTDENESIMSWSYGGDKYPQTGLNKGMYRLFFVLKIFYRNLSNSTMKSIQGNKFVARTAVLQMIDQCGPTLQERVVHLLTEHTAADESITDKIFYIVKTMQKNPRVLDFCTDCQDKGKLNVDGITILLQYLQSQSQDYIKQLMRGTYWEAFNQLDKERSARCKDGLNNELVLDYVDQLKQNYPAVFTSYTLMETASKTLSMTNPQYKHSELQTAVACFMNQPDSCSILSKAGTGKTNMIFILARCLLNESKSFAIVVANEYLYHQMYHDTKIFFPEEDVLVISIDQLDVTFAKEKILILDEADAMIDQDKIILREEYRSTAELGGLVAAAHAKRLVLLSATFQAHHKQFMRQVLGIQTKQMHEFKSSGQLAIKSAYNQLSCSKHVFAKLQDFYKLNEQVYLKHAAEKPLICFIEQKDAQFEAWLAHVATKSGAPFYTIDSIESAKQYREALKQSKLGVMLVSSQFARGFDLKMAQDGFGLVVANGNQLKPSTIAQMFGRTNRSQGEPEGALIMIDAKHKLSNDAWRMIEARDKIEPTHGFVNLGLLAKSKIDVHGGNLNLLKSAYMNDAWQINEHQFKRNNKKLTSILLGMGSQDADPQVQKKRESDGKHN